MLHSARECTTNIAIKIDFPFYTWNYPFSGKKECGLLPPTETMYWHTNSKQAHIAHAFDVRSNIVKKPETVCVGGFFAKPNYAPLAAAFSIDIMLSGLFFRRLGRREMRTVKISGIARTRPGTPGAGGCIGSILLRPLSDGERPRPTIFTLRRFFALFPEKGHIRISPSKECNQKNDAAICVCPVLKSRRIFVLLSKINPGLNRLRLGQVQTGLSCRSAFTIFAGQKSVLQDFSGRRRRIAAGPH